jgi:ribosome-binding ATPase YchF (GTP1/OBG family)
LKTTIPLLTTKNFLIVANVSEDDMQNKKYEQNPHFISVIKKFGTHKVVATCVKLEYELSRVSPEEREMLKEELNIQEESLPLIIKKAYENLDLITFFTCGPQEIHAWPIKKGTAIKQAAGEIHSDLEKGFICAEVLSYDDLIEYKTPALAKQAGKVRIEGASYLVHDGDIVLVRFNK